MKQSQKERLEQFLKDFNVLYGDVGTIKRETEIPHHIQVKVQIFKELLELSVEPKPVLLVTLPRTASSVDIDRTNKSLNTLYKVSDDYHILVLVSGEEVKVEILSVKDIDSITVEELQKKVLDSIKQ